MGEVLARGQVLLRGMPANTQKIDTHDECHNTAICTRPKTRTFLKFPQSPRIQTVSKELRDVLDDGKVAETSKGLRLFEIGYPSVYSFPAQGVDVDFLLSIYGDKVCEYLRLMRSWKIEEFGICLECAAWSGPNPAEVCRKMRLLPFSCRCLLGRPGPRPRAGRGFLRRVDHASYRRPIHG